MFTKTPDATSHFSLWKAGRDKPKMTCTSNYCASADSGDDYKCKSHFLDYLAMYKGA